MASDLDQPGERLDRLPLAEVIPERHREARQFMVLVKPIFKQPPGHVRRTGVAVLSPNVHRRPDLRHQQQSTRRSARGVLPPASRRRVVLHQERGWLLPWTAVGDLGQIFVISDDGAGHGYFTSTSKACEVSLPKMSITFTRMRCFPGFP